MSADISVVPIICRKDILHHIQRGFVPPICELEETKSCLVLNGVAALSLFGKLLYVFSNAIDRN